MAKPGGVAQNPDRLRALQRANQIRAARAELKRQIADGTIRAAHVILNPPPAATSWPLAELLLAQRNWGRAKSKKFLARNQLSEFKAIGELTERQRLVLAAQL